MMIEGMVLGLAYVLPPGPVTAETMRRSIRGGVPAALAVQVGAVGGDLCYVLLLLAGFSQLLSQSPLHSAAGLLGSALLLILGISTLRGWRTATHVGPGEPAGAPTSLWRLLGVGFLVSLLNPFAAAFWLTAGSAAIDAAPIWVAGFMMGSLLASLLTGLVLGRLQGQGTGRYTRWVSLTCGCVLIAFGLRQGWNLFNLL